MKLFESPDNVLRGQLALDTDTTATYVPDAHDAAMMVLAEKWAAQDAAREAEEEERAAQRRAMFQGFGWTTTG